MLSAEATELFVGPDDAPLQLVRVTYCGLTEAASVQVRGDGLSTPEPGRAEAGDGVVDVAVVVRDPEPGRRRAAQVELGAQRCDFSFLDAEPGWTMYMVSHFHYDPVWWNTQAAYTSEWTEDPPGACRQTNGFALVAAHLELARRDPQYKFVLAEVDYLKPYWDTRPEDRADLRRFLAEGRVEVMGGTYNEPNTNLTSAETAIRNLVHGIGFQRTVLGADPATAWQLDVFGHDPQFPGMAADVGLTSSSWARGPFHQWGPMADGGDPERMQFASEFEWIAPSGTGLLTHYMPAHYSAGWWMDSAATLADAETATHELFRSLQKVAATRNVLLPVGTDYTPPNKWVTEIHRDWNDRYTWPKFVCGLPKEFFAAVRAELAERGATPSPQTRDMNPIYTGKDVSFIDTKQANRAAEAALLDAERFAAFAHLLTGAAYPEAALAKAWVQLAYGAHHDAITGSESDQVYLDLLTSWRDAWEIGHHTAANALTALTAAVGAAPLTVWNPLARNRTDVVTAHLTQPAGPRSCVLDDTGAPVPTVVGDDGHTVSWLAADVPSLGWRAYRLGDAATDTGWQPVDGVRISNAHYEIQVDPDRGGGVVSLRHGGRELIADGRVGNELAVYQEHSAHPKAGEGPWHLLPKGPVRTSSSAPAQVHAVRCPLGERLVIRGGIDGVLRYTQTLTLWHGLDRVDCQTVLDDFVGEDQLVRLRWPTPVPGAVPVCEVGDAVIGRGFGLLHTPGSTESVDTATQPWTLENPAFGWFGLSSAARLRCSAEQVQAVAVAEVITPADAESGPLARELLVALVRAGVTATCSAADRPRYGHLEVDSNLPDTRIAIGGPDRNPFSAAVLAAADPDYTAELERQLTQSDSARVLIPAVNPVADEWVPDADLRAVRALPVLVLAGRDEAALVRAVRAVAADLDDAEIEVPQHPPGVRTGFEAGTVAVLNRGVPSFAVESDGTLHTSLMRSCTGWPSGVWTTHERRSAPDGSNFQLQHWSHTFDYAVVAGTGDWRAAGVPAHSAEFSRPLYAVPGLDVAAEPVPGSGSLLRVRGGQAHVEAVKLAGNPTPAGSAAAVSGQLAVRLVEACGRDVEIELGSDVAALTVRAKADLLEQSRQPISAVRLHGYEIATVLTEFESHRGSAADPPVRLAPDAEAAQPLYARYWLHNRGPAPLGGLPAVAHLHPHRIQTDDAEFGLRLTAASDCTDVALRGQVRLHCPPGWSARPAVLPFTLEPGAHLEAEIRISAPSTAPGCYPVRAELALTGTDLPAAWRQPVEDVCLVQLGQPADADAAAFRLIDGPHDVELAAGHTGRLTVQVAGDLAGDLALEAHLISPWGTWEWLGPAAVGALLPAAGQIELAFDVSPPRWLEPGQWWALIRVAGAGQLAYSSAARVVVT